ncbi:hypothetical protein EYC80_003489 [Monilinia laxa]|uniref:Endonuclease/exonuclease/phosphatase domain-containing protein n=1 Tax=Monilinia laxa TaxID=61186 RepID=A0A5N6KE59_MONLA|nr:hypothetical protein EYC80_003489 [Monilinia laxa]
MTREKTLSNFEDERIFISTSSKNNNSTSIPVRVITHNIRYATESPFKGEELWSIRCPRLCSELVFNSTKPETFICLQEVLHSQLIDIHNALNQGPGSEWSHLGVGRDDGKESGEYSPIFYRPAVWDLVLYRTFWLSETPDKPSFGWDAGCIRLVTLGIFRHWSTNEVVVIMSTHLDNAGPISRQKSAELILEKVGHYKSIYAPAALLLAGDFNSPPDDEAYKTMTSPISSMTDVRDLIPEKNRYGNELTFTSFGYVDNTPTRIDFIFSAKATSVRYGTYAVLSNRYDDGVYLSDHRAVVADIEFERLAMSARLVIYSSHVLGLHVLRLLPIKLFSIPLTILELFHTAQSFFFFLIFMKVKHKTIVEIRLHPRFSMLHRFGSVYPRPDDNAICQRCHQTKGQCIVREKARPRRSRGARRAGRLEPPKVEDSPLSSNTSISTENPLKDGEFSLDLPTAVYHDPKKDAEFLQDHHKRIFKDDNSRSPTPSKEILHLPPKYISSRKLTLSQATHLLNSYIPKLPFFPFVTLPGSPTIPTLSQQSPFLLLAILTVAAIPHPYLHHQLDQEFRRVLSLKLIVESQKSLDYLLGLLVYIAWYPVHTKPKLNPCSTYMNLANSLALDLGLDQERPQIGPFREFDLKGLVDSNGNWTVEAKRAYMGCYVLGSQSFNKPQIVSYDNLLPSNGDSFIPSIRNTPATAIVILERISDRINDTWTAKTYPQMDTLSTELYIQVFAAELETWKRNVPESITTSPLLALYHKFTHLSLYSHSLRLLRRPAAIESSASEKFDTSSNKGRRKQLDKYFIMHGMLSTVKKTWEKRVEAIAPKASTISRGKCPVFDPGMASLLESASLDFDFGDMEAWDDNLDEAMMEWNNNIEEVGTSSTFSASNSKTPGDGEVGLQVVSGENVTIGGGEVSGVSQHGSGGTIYNDLWATMTCSWAEQPPAWSILDLEGVNIGGNGGGVFGYQVNEG